MFTGIIQAVGQIEEIKTTHDDLKLKINAGKLALTDMQEGDSIAVNGVCLTATNIDSQHFEVHISKETLSITTGLDTKTAVNLEKALRLNDKLGGHLVSGHVDGVGKVTHYDNLGDCWLFAIDAPHAISKYIARKGSICINGVSLTINTIKHDIFTVNIIPHTLQETTFAQLTKGSHVNLEIDQIARYVERIAEWATESI